VHTEVVAASASSIARAARLLGEGGIVAFPTETVYGLGALAADADAVRQIFAAKGRPEDKPLIVHVLDVEQARQAALHWDDRAERLARAFWPGPLTLVMARAAWVPDVVTAGGETVAVRAPAHPVARALLVACAASIAAPSANPSGEPPPTSAAEVVRGLGGRIPLVLDGGVTPLKIPSTIVALEPGVARVLRQGALERERIAALVPLTG
jgi:L-threonylcarbamoyladenylate synthase